VDKKGVGMHKKICFLVLCAAVISLSGCASSGGKNKFCQWIENADQWVQKNIW